MNTLHKFAVLTLSAVLTVCLLAGCGGSAANSTALSITCITDGIVSRKRPLIRAVTSIRGRLSSISGMTSRPLVFMMSFSPALSLRASMRSGVGPMKTRPFRRQRLAK